MIYRDKKVCKIQVVNNSKDGEVIATICDSTINCTNGYEVKIEYETKEVCK